MWTGLEWARFSQIQMYDMNHLNYGFQGVAMQCFNVMLGSYWLKSKAKFNK